MPKNADLPDDIFAAAQELDFDEVVILGVNEGGQITTLHTLGELPTLDLLESAVSRMRMDVLESLVERIKSVAH